MYRANVTITLRKSILDPQGKAAHSALKNLGLNQIETVRIGKLIQLDIDAESESSARKLADTACSKLLANEVMEDYTIEIEKQ